MRKIVFLNEANATTKTAQYLAASALEAQGKPVPEHLKKALAWGKANPESVERIRAEKSPEELSSAGLQAKAGRKAKTLVAQSRDAAARNAFESDAADTEDGKTHTERHYVTWRDSTGTSRSGSTDSVELDNPEAYQDAIGKGMRAGIRSQQKLRGATAYVRAGQKIKRDATSTDAPKKGKEELRSLDQSIDSRTYTADKAAGAAERLSKSNSPGAKTGAARKKIIAGNTKQQFRTWEDVFDGADEVKNKLGVDYNDEHKQGYRGKGVSGKELYLPRDEERTDISIGKRLSDDSRTAADTLSDRMRTGETRKKIEAQKQLAATKASERKARQEENEAAHQRNLKAQAAAERKAKEKKTGLSADIDPEDF